MPLTFFGHFFDLLVRLLCFVQGGGVFQYYVKIVRTTYEYVGGRQVISNQYAVTEHHQKPIAVRFNLITPCGQ